MNPQMLMAMLQGGMNQPGAGGNSLRGTADGIGEIFSKEETPTKTMLMLAGMGLSSAFRELPKVMNAMMDMNSMGKEDSQEQPGALPTPPEGEASAAPPGMPPQGMPGGGMPPPGGVPPQMVPMLLQLAAMRRMQQPQPPMPMPGMA